MSTDVRSSHVFKMICILDGILASQVVDKSVNYVSFFRANQKLCISSVGIAS